MATAVGSMTTGRGMPRVYGAEHPLESRGAPEWGSELGRGCMRSCDSFQILPDEMTDVEVASAIHKARPHIIVELNALTRGGRHGALAMRPAPLQISFLGSSGMPSLLQSGDRRGRCQCFPELLRG
eukprot:gene27300-33625_t